MTVFILRFFIKFRYFIHAEFLDIRRVEDINFSVVVNVSDVFLFIGQVEFINRVLLNDDSVEDVSAAIAEKPPVKVCAAITAAVSAETQAFFILFFICVILSVFVGYRLTDNI